MDKPEDVPNAQWIQLGGVKFRHGVKKIQGWTLVDDADYDELSQFNWYLGTDGYAYRNMSLAETGDGPRSKEAMHRRLLNMAVYPKGMVPDHINRDRLDNRRSNLRVVPSQGHNLHNQSKRRGNYNSRFRGVSKYSAKGFTYWRARIQLNGKEIYGEYFSYTPENEIRAAEAVMRARRRLMPFSTEARMTEAEFEQAIRMLAVPEAA